MGKKILSIDFQKESVSAVLINAGFKGGSLAAYGTVPISEHDALEAAVAELYRKLQKKQDLSGAAVHMSLSGDDFFIRNLTLPFTDRRKIAQILPSELEMHLPFDPESLVFDFTHTKSKRRSDVLAAMIRKQEFDQCVNSLGKRRQNLALATIKGCPAAFSAMKMEKTTGQWMYLDIGDDSCTLYFMENRNTAIIRSFQLDSMDADAESFSLEVEKGVKRTLMYAETVLKKPLHPKHIRFEWTELPNFLKAVDTPGALSFEKQTELFRKGLERNLDIPVTWLDLFSQATAHFKIRNDIPEAQRMDAGTRTLMGHAVALCMMDIAGNGVINLHQKPFILSTIWEKQRGGVITAVVLCFLTSIMAGFSAFMDVSALKRSQAVIDSEITRVFQATFPEIKRVVAPLRQMRALVRNAGEPAAVNGFARNRYRMLELIMAVSDNIPKETDVEFTRMNISPEGMTLYGSTDGYHSVNELKTRLEKSDMIKEVDITSSKFDNSKKRLMFQFNARFEK